MSKAKHYSPELNRFVLCVLYHEAKERNQPMTTLANQLLSEALTGGEGWKKAMLQYQESTEETAAR